jgi:hypothetical protein
MITTAEEFVSLRRSEHQQDYLRAATDVSSNEVWFDVIERYPDMRIWVAHNKTIPLEVLEVLARDPDAEVRLAVAMKNKLSGELFWLLANDTEEGVRQRIACNKKTPVEILKHMANDPAELVSAPAKERTSTSS